MIGKKRANLKRAGWRVGDAAELLGIPTMDAVLIDVKTAMGETLRSRRAALGESQVSVAKLLESSQSRVAKLEAGDPSVSVDLLLRALFTLGVTTGEVARIFARAGKTRPA